LDFPDYKIYSYNDIGFDNSFNNFRVRDKNIMLRSLENRYIDWDDMIYKKYTIMYNTFVESGKSKLYCSPSNLSFVLKYLIKISDNVYKVVIIMSADGKKSRRYHRSIGKFTITL